MSLNVTQLKHEISLLESQLSSFNNKKTKSSATSSRRHLLQIVKHANSMRKSILVISKENLAAKKPKPVPAAEPVLPTVPEVTTPPVAETSALPLEKPVLKRELTAATLIVKRSRAPRKRSPKKV